MSVFKIILDPQGVGNTDKEKYIVKRKRLGRFFLKNHM